VDQTLDINSNRVAKLLYGAYLKNIIFWIVESIIPLLMLFFFFAVISVFLVFGTIENDGQWKSFSF